MPIYEYVCRECGEPVEKLQKMADPPLTDCPSCGKSALKRKVSAAAFRLAGSGWYETDFKTKNKHHLAGGSEHASGNSDTSSAGGAESGSSVAPKKDKKSTTSKASDSAA